MDREQLLRLVVAERFAPNGRDERRQPVRALVDHDGGPDTQITQARRRRVLCDAIDHDLTARHTRKAAAA